ncbi:MAG TPA: hypothetical protein VLQ79_09325 [Myxococcaceae bacterium]|nr:hypothetical protein [Myxococcaceae bacterium]
MTRVRTSAYLRFRGSAEALRERLPPSLSSLGRALRTEAGGAGAAGDVTSAAEVELAPAALDRALAWGRTVAADGRTLLRSAYVEDHHERAELEGMGLVELVRPIRAEAPPVRNLAAAYALTWACDHCDRVRARQVGDLRVDLDEAAEALPGFRGHPEVLFTRGRELLVAARWQRLLRARSVDSRPLSGNRAYVQVLVPETVALRTDQPPLEAGETCPGCGVTAIHRVAIVEGDPPLTDATGLWVSRERALSIHTPPTVAGALVASTRRIGELVTIHPERMHGAGDPVPAELAEGILAQRGSSVFFVSEPLLAALWDGGATGLEFRPVVRVS